MTLITTVDRVRNRMGFTTSDLTDPIIEDFIADQQAVPMGNYPSHSRSNPSPTSRTQHSSTPSGS